MRRWRTFRSSEPLGLGWPEAAPSAEIRSEASQMFWLKGERGWGATPPVALDNVLPVVLLRESACGLDRALLFPRRFPGLKWFYLHGQAAIPT